MKTVFFISDGTELTASVSHRCSMISNNLKKLGHKSEVYTSGTIFRVQNFVNHFNIYKKIIKEKPDIVVLHKTSNIIDYYMIKKLKKLSIKVIYDFDDALFHIRLPGRLIAYSHLNQIIKLSDAVTAGSHYLVDYARKFNEKVFLLPTPVDNELFKPTNNIKEKNVIVIGWLGNGNDFQLRYLKMLKEPLKRIAENHSIKFRIISALSGNVRKEFKNENYEVDFGFDKWVPLNYIPKEISDFDIGVMPLTDDTFAKGKCAMKALEYMAMGIPVVVSSVGENNYVIKNSFNGFLVSDTEEWVKVLEKLIHDTNLRKVIGSNGIETVKEKYSLDVVTLKFLEIFRGLE
ncbi:glycosyltransferase family 4 protein [Methanobacterium formicicum]|uniref:Glycosyltransferase family 4 protein n=1 Tax=Methanobacterium formicicum TaxID=2162 RepID=A0A843AJ90_METFO|nr:glycosyltransferase family 4 protein [Methanobacterium formicicum]MBF4475247.1 glycosyltransferase family 4 protein [Methanobacterium formicicum]